MKNTTALAATILALTPVSGMAGSSQAPIQNIQEPEASISDWHWKANLYGWAESLDGNVTIRGRYVPVDIGFDDILENLDFAIMGSAEVSYGRWGLLADMSYAELSGSSYGRRSVVNVGLDQFIGNFALAYEIFGEGNSHLDLYAGARVNSLDLDAEFIGRRLFARTSQSETWVDPIIGLRFQQELSERFFLRLVGDVGGFNVSSDFTWQAMGILGFRMTEHSSLLFGYRGIGTDFSSGTFGYDVTTQGVLLGVEVGF